MQQYQVDMEDRGGTSSRLHTKIVEAHLENHTGPVLGQGRRTQPFRAWKQNRKTRPGGAPLTEVDLRTSSCVAHLTSPTKVRIEIEKVGRTMSALPTSREHRTPNPPRQLDLPLGPALQRRSSRWMGEEECWNMILRSLGPRGNMHDVGSR